MRLPNRPVTVSQLQELTDMLLMFVQVYVKHSANETQVDQLRRDLTSIITREPVVEPTPVRSAEADNRTDEQVAEARRKLAEERSGKR